MSNNPLSHLTPISRNPSVGKLTRALQEYLRDANLSVP
jgi:hypothetical protein